MPPDQSFQLTLANNKTEKEGVIHLLENHVGFFSVDRTSKKKLLGALGISEQYLNAFDLIYVPDLAKTEVTDEFINTYLDEVLFIELKVTKKKLPNNPYGFFFGATENEFNFAHELGERFRFCFVCLHHETQSFKLLTLTETESLIRTKRIQYQINLVSGMPDSVEAG